MKYRLKRHVKGIDLYNRMYYTDDGITFVANWNDNKTQIIVNVKTREVKSIGVEDTELKNLIFLGWVEEIM